MPRALVLLAWALPACITVPERDLTVRDAAGGGSVVPDAATGDATASGGTPGTVGGADANTSTPDADPSAPDADPSAPDARANEGDARQTATDARTRVDDARLTPMDAAVAPAADGFDQPVADTGSPQPDGAVGPCEPAEEVCNGRDDDCDGETDEGIAGCCSGSEAPPCNGCPAGIVVPPGFVCVPGGEYSMGAPADEPGREPDEVSHRARVTSPFLIGRTEVTQAEYLAATGSNPSVNQACAECPVENVSWYDAVAYANVRSRAEGRAECYLTVGGVSYSAAHAVSAEPVRLAGGGASPVACAGYRLPTEAEWERAARAGTVTPTYGAAVGVLACERDAALDAIAWYCGNAGNRSHPAGQKAANAFGLVDTLGNAWEWCWDVYDQYPAGLAVDPVGPEPPGAGTINRVLRGGTYTGGARHVRAASRGYHDAATRHEDVGLRLVRTLSNDR